MPPSPLLSDNSGVYQLFGQISEDVQRRLERVVYLAVRPLDGAGAVLTALDAAGTPHPVAAYPATATLPDALPAQGADGSAATFTLPIRGAEGRRLGALVILAPAALEGASRLFDALDGLAREALEALTEHQQGEAERDHLKAFYEQVLDQLPAQVDVFDTAARFVYVPPSAGRDEALRQWAIGRTNTEYFEQRGLDGAPGRLRDDIIRKVVAERKGHAFEETLPQRDGSLRHLLRFLAPVLDADGAVAYVVGHSMDVTERKEYESHLITARNQAEELNDLKSAFLANMSHEIRTPLTSIMGFADILAEEAAPTFREFAQLIRRSSERLMETLNSVLDLAQLEGRSLRLTPVPIDLCALMQETQQLFRPQAEARGLALRYVAHVKAPLVVENDLPALIRVLNNLVGNALKFTREGDVTLSVDADATHALLEVTDTGVGIAPAFLPHLFDEFKQESQGLGRDFEGSGLGLAITKRLLDLMGGAIEVESHKGLGSTFTVRLPRYVAA